MLDYDLESRGELSLYEFVYRSIRRDIEAGTACAPREAAFQARVRPSSRCESHYRGERLRAAGDGGLLLHETPQRILRL